MNIHLTKMRKVLEFKLLANKYIKSVEIERVIFTGFFREIPFGERN